MASPTCPPPPYAMGALVRDVERLIEHFALKDAVILGAGDRRPCRPGPGGQTPGPGPRLVLSDTAARFGTARRWAAPHRHRARRRPRPSTPTLQPCFGRPLAQAARRHAGATDAGPHPPEGWIGLAAAIASTDFYQTTATLSLPTLALAGADDGKTPPDLQRETADLDRRAGFPPDPRCQPPALLTHPQPFAYAAAPADKIAHV